MDSVKGTAKGRKFHILETAMLKLQAPYEVLTSTSVGSDLYPHMPTYVHPYAA